MGAKSVISNISISWNSSYEYDGLLFFFQRIVEMLDYRTIDIYRAPLLNTSRLIDEYIRISNGSAKPYHLEEVYNEFIMSFKTDIVLQHHLGEERIHQIIKRLNKSPDSRKQTMEYLRHSVADRYLKWIKSYIELIVPQNKEKRKIERAIRCFLPELLRYGYSRDEIYHSAKQILQAETEPSTALSSFLKQYDKNKKKYCVYLGISENLRQFDDLLKTRLGVDSHDDGNFCKCEVWRHHYIVKMDKIEALDASRAANTAYDDIELFTLFYQFWGNYSGNLIQKPALVISEDGIERKLVINREKYASIENDDPPKIGELSELVITRLVNSAQCSLPILRQITKLHNRAISNNGLENGFLNLWSIMEIICVSNQDGSKIDQIISVAVPILKRYYFYCLISDIFENAKNALEPEILRPYVESVEEGEAECDKFACLILMPKYEDLFNGFVDHFTNYPVLRSRMLNLHDDCQSKKDILNLQNRYAQRVSWHMYRIYRARNSIIHSGKKPTDLKDLGEHLHSYVDCLIEEILMRLSTGSLCHISNVLVNSELQNEVIEKKLNDDLPIDYDSIKLILSNMESWID